MLSQRRKELLEGALVDEGILGKILGKGAKQNAKKAAKRVNPAAVAQRRGLRNTINALDERIAKAKQLMSKYGGTGKELKIKKMLSILGAQKKKVYAQMQAVPA